MGLLRNNKKTNKEPHQQDVAPITLSKTEAEVLLKAIINYRKKTQLNTNFSRS